MKVHRFSHLLGCPRPWSRPCNIMSCTWPHTYHAFAHTPWLHVQFHSTRENADELEAYLRQQEQRAKEAEFQALAKADLGGCRGQCGVPITAQDINSSRRSFRVVLLSFGTHGYIKDVPRRMEF